MEETMDGELFFCKIMKGMMVLLAVVILVGLVLDFRRDGWSGVSAGDNLRDAFALLACGLYAADWWLWRKGLLKSRLLHAVIAALLIFGADLSQLVRSLV